MNKQNLRSVMDRRLSGLKAEQRHVDHVLQIVKGEEKVTKKHSSALIIAIAIIAIAGIAIAATLSPTIEWFGYLYGPKLAEELEQGTIIPISQARDLGDVRYEWVETIHVSVPEERREPVDPEDRMEDEELQQTNEFAANNVLYGTVKITPKEGANIVLIPEDFSINDPMGYNIYYGEKAPEDAPSYLDTAIAKNARIILAKAVPDGVILNGELQIADIGYACTPNKDGSLTYHYEVYNVPQMDEYTIQMYIGNWEINREGGWLREEPNNTLLSESWTLTVKPETKE